MVPQQLERALLVDPVALHENPFCALDHRASAEGAFEAVELGEATKDDVQRTLELLRVAVGDVGEDSALRRLVDVARKKTAYSELGGCSFISSGTRASSP